MSTKRAQKTLVFDKAVLNEYQALCDNLGFRVSLRIEHYMKKDLVLLRGYAKKLKV